MKSNSYIHVTKDHRGSLYLKKKKAKQLKVSASDKVNF